MKNTSAKVLHAVISFGLVLSLLYCYITAFDIKINNAVLVISAAVFSTAFSAVCILIKDNFKLLCTYGGVGIGFLIIAFLSENQLLCSLNYGVNCVLKFYGNYFSLPKQVHFSGYEKADATIVFLALAYLLGALITLILTRTKFIFPAVAISVLLVIPCFMIVDTQPDTAAIITFVILLLSLFIGKFFRRFNPHNYLKAMLSVTAILLILSLNICRIFPRAEFERFEWQTNMLTNVQNFSQSIINRNADNVSNSANNYADTISLSNLGNRTLTGQEVMRVYTDDNPRKLYLRGVSYSVFNDNNWTVPDDNARAEMPVGVNVFTGLASYTGIVRSLDVEMLVSSDVMFVPYYLEFLPLNSTAVYDEYVGKERNLNQYTASYYVNQFKSASMVNNDYAEYARDYYTQLDENTATQLRQIADENSISYDISTLYKEKIVNDVAEFVKNHGRYSLTVEKMPSGKDFPVWFLTEADRGYCMHYATACTAMLRALGIPARYVTGYVVNTSKEQWTQVTSNEAHAWTEYYDDVNGWTIVDATPSAVENTADDDEQAEESTAATESTAPSQTVETTSAAENTHPQTEADNSSDRNNNTIDDNGISYRSAADNQGINNTLITVFIIIATVVIVIVAALLLFVLRRKHKMKKLNAEINATEPNKRALNIYGYIGRLLKYSNISVNEKAENIALKAKFSHHTLSEEEVSVLSELLENIKTEILQSSSVFKKLFLKYIKAII